METIYQKQEEFLRKKFELRQLAHGYLFSGQDTQSILSFAKEFVALVNCLGDSLKKSCGECQNCRMIKSSNFPDLLTIKSSLSPSSLKNEKDMMEISIEQIRDAQLFLSYKSYYGNFKAVIIENAERMSLEAQHCFLKNLEEPKGKTLLFLISSKADLLLPTITSRCQQIKFLFHGQHESYGQKTLSHDLLSIIQGDLAEKFQYAKKTNLEGENFQDLLGVLRQYFRELLLINIGVVKGEAGKYSTIKLKKIIKLIEDIDHKTSLTNVNRKLALEILLMEI